MKVFCICFSLLTACQVLTTRPNAILVGRTPALRVAIQQTDEAASLNAKGLTLYEAGNYLGAVEAFKQAIKRKKDYADAYYNLGNAYLRSAQYKKAIDAYQQAIRLKPDCSLAYNNMGTAHFKLGEHQKAIEAYKQTLRLDPKSTATYFNLGSTYLQSGNEEAALVQYGILKTLDPRAAKELFVLIYRPTAAVLDAGGSNEVRLNVTVTDPAGLLAGDLEREDFQVFEDGAAQELSFFSKQVFPVAYGLAIDGSGSFLPALEEGIKVAKAIVQSSSPEDQTLLVRFVDSDKIQKLLDFTSDKAALNQEIDNLYVEAGRSAILDAVHLSAQALAQYEAPDASYVRRAMVLITDGEERSSYYKLQDVLKLLRTVDVQLFAINLEKSAKKGVLLNENSKKGARELLTELAEQTGGHAFFPKSVSDLPRVAAEIGSIVHTQYLIGYKPSRPAVLEAYRSVTVSIADSPERTKRIARTRLFCFS